MRTKTAFLNLFAKTVGTPHVFATAQSFLDTKQRDTAGKPHPKGKERGPLACRPGDFEVFERLAASPLGEVQRSSAELKCDLRSGSPNRGDPGPKHISPESGLQEDGESRTTSDHLMSVRLFRLVHEFQSTFRKLHSAAEELGRNFDAQEAEGTFYAGDEPLVEPLYVSMVEDPIGVEATALLKLKSGDYLCEGTVEVTATVEG